MLTYQSAGVDIEATSALKKRIAHLVKSTFSPAVLSDIGLFGSLYELKGYQQPVLVGSCDGVGTKLMVARMMNRYDTVGQDLVNHCVNDILTLGAKPLFFLDYIAYSALPASVVPEVVKGLVRACRQSGCALIGGETAMMPGLYPKGECDLAGFIVGVVEKPEIINPKRVQPGDIIVGLPSTGLHTNGYSLARKVLFDENKFHVTDLMPRISLKPQATPETEDRSPETRGGNRKSRMSNVESRTPIPDSRFEIADAQESSSRGTIGDALLSIHRCYLPVLSPYLKQVKALAHITGGGFKDNIERLLPGDVNCTIHRDAWEPLPIFRAIQECGHITDDEMYHVFNMGIGMVIIADDAVTQLILTQRREAKIIGEVTPGKGEVSLT
jgi:phosphoribosylformylglycinamidine cyclo-ligase